VNLKYFFTEIERFQVQFGWLSFLIGVPLALYVEKFEETNKALNFRTVLTLREDQI
jgi:hypothetical protein